jgi:hypothetical protein
MTTLADLGLVDAADAVARREVSSAALLEACLGRLDAVNKTVNATIWVDIASARAWRQRRPTRRSPRASPRAVCTAFLSPTRTCTTRQACPAPAARPSRRPPVVQ